MSCSVAKGNLAEYLLPAMMLGLVAVGGLAWVLTPSAQESNRLASLFQGDSLQPGQPGGKSIQIRSLGQDPTFQSYQLVTDKGNTILLTNFPVSAIQSVEAIGTQGTTEKYAALIRQMADQLLKSGEITIDEANEIKVLADKGFDIGQKLGKWENLLKQCNHDAQCVKDFYFTQTPESVEMQALHSSLSYNTVGGIQSDGAEASGQAVLNLELSKYISSRDKSGATQQLLDAGAQMTSGAVLLDFWEARVNVAKKGLHPKIQETLDFLGDSINSIGSYSSYFIRTSANEGKGLIDNASIAKALKAANAVGEEKPSFLVNTHSSHICTVGQGTTQTAGDKKDCL
jgi:hypothetical protein